MAISIPQGYIVTSREPIDNRLVLTKQQMKDISRPGSKASELLPPVYFCVCYNRDQKMDSEKTVYGANEIYVYNERNE